MPWILRSVAAALLLTACATHSAWAGNFHINLVVGTGLQGNTAALQAFQRAAAQWESRINDPITVNINANLDALGAGTIGEAGSFELIGTYDEIRTAMVADAAGSPSNAIVAFLPTTLTATLPAGFTLGTDTVLTKANAKALGFADLDVYFGSTDGQITFSNQFAFDYNRSNGIDAGKIDFESVAAHEIGHILGFQSSVDDLDVAIASGYTEGTVNPHVLDLFRFANVPGQKPTNGLDFSILPRNLTPGDEAVLSDTASEFSMSTGKYNGDGRQASHWKDSELTGTRIGVMDPTIDYGETFDITNADFRTLDLIGYDVTSVPEPGTWTMLAIGGVGMFLVRRRMGKMASKS